MIEVAAMDKTTLFWTAWALAFLSGVFFGIGVERRLFQIKECKAQPNISNKLDVIAMKNGFYWIHQEGEDPEIVEIEDGCMYFCGSDVVGRLSGEEWIMMGEPMRPFSLSGPVNPWQA